MDTIKSNDFSKLSDCQKSLHLAVGMFDGVHLGHRSVIDSAIRSAGLDNGLSGVFTFHPHPSHYFIPESPTPQIYPTEVKRFILESMSVDLYLEQVFDEGLASMTAEAFVAYLVNQFPTLASISIGENFRFGKGRMGDVSLLVKLASAQSISVYSSERVQCDGQAISSTRLRGMLDKEPIEKINRLLGHTYTTMGTIIEGEKVGRTIGFPTLNMPWNAEIAPSYGVYAVRYQLAGHKKAQEGVANFGLRPTVNTSSNSVPLLEIHSLEPTQLSYGDNVTVQWIKKIRTEKKFSGLEELKSAINADKEAAKVIFNKT